MQCMRNLAPWATECYLAEVLPGTGLSTLLHITDMRLDPRPICRRALLIAGAALWSAPQTPPAHGVTIPERSELQRIQQQLYSPLPEMKTYQQQISDAIRIKSMRGVWELRETDSGGKARVGRLVFRGAETEQRGRVTYEGDAARGRGPWILKSDGFGSNPTGTGGIIEQKALWKLRRGDEGTFTYTSRVNVPSYTGNMPDAIMSGQVVQLINGGKPKGGTEKVVGKFEASLQRLLTADDERAEVNSEASGGAPEAIELKPVYDDALVYRQQPSSDDPLDAPALR